MLLKNWGQTPDVGEKKKLGIFSVSDRGLTAKMRLRQDGDFTIFFFICTFCYGIAKAISQVFWIAFCDVVGRADWLTAHICLIAVVWSVGGVSG